MPADVLAPKGARPPAGTMMAEKIDMFSSIYQQYHVPLDQVMPFQMANKLSRHFLWKKTD